MGRQTQKATRIAVLICLGVVLIISCAKPYHDVKERYFFVATNTALPFWQEARTGFLDSAKVLGVKAELIGPTGYSPNAELVTFRQVVEQQPSGICLSAARPELFQSEIDKAVAQGIPVICVDADVPNSKRPIKNFPEVKITKIVDDKGDARNASDIVADLIQKKEKVDGIICLEASGGSGAAEAMHRLNAEGKLQVVAFDDDPQTLDWIDRGAIAVTIAQKPYVMSYYALKFVDDLHHNALHKFKDWRTEIATQCPILWTLEPYSSTRPTSKHIAMRWQATPIRNRANGSTSVWPPPRPLPTYSPYRKRAGGFPVRRTYHSHRNTFADSAV